MRVAICLVATVLISGPRNQDPTVKGYVPPNGFVPDSGTAVRIASQFGFRFTEPVRSDRNSPIARPLRMESGP